MQDSGTVETEIESDGFKLALAIHKPNSAVRAAIILCPGYLDSKDYPHLVALGEACAKTGILAVRLDPVGTWDSGGNESDYSVSRYLQNIASVESYINKNYGVSDILIGGHSLGGFVSVLYGARSPAKAVVALCAPKEMLGTASKTWQQDGVRHSTRDLPDGSGERSYNVPWAFAEDSSQYSAIRAVKAFEDIPLLLLACGKDGVVPPEEVKAIYEAAHEPKEYVLNEDMTHDYRKDRIKVKQVTDQVMDWLQTINL